MNDGTAPGRTHRSILHLREWSARGAIALAPLLVPVFLVWHYFDSSILSITPAGPDEVDYWHEVDTFREVGFAGGYYGVDQAVPAWDFLHFGAHGPVFPALFGSIARIVGWHPGSGPVFNAVAMVLAGIVFLALVKPSGRLLALIFVVLATYWPITLYLDTGMQESLQQAIAVVLAGLFVVIVRTPEQDRRRVLRVTVGVLLVACLLRTTWSFTFIPLFFMISSSRIDRRIMLAMVKAAPLIAGSFIFARWTSAPFPNFASGLMSTAASSPRTAARNFIDHLVVNVRALNDGPPVNSVLRAVIVFVVLASAITLIVAYRRRTAGDSTTIAWVHLLNLVPIFVFTMAFYDTVLLRDYRLLAPHLLLSILVAVALGDRIVIGAALASALVGSLFIGPTFRDYNGIHFADVDPKARELSHLVSYAPGASPWRNTVLIDQANFRNQLLSIPPGVGFTLWYRERPHNIRTQYLLVNDETFEEIGQPELWKLIGQTSTGRLYVRQPGAPPAG